MPENVSAGNSTNNEETFICSSCGDTLPMSELDENISENTGENICDNCGFNYSYCDRCGGYYHAEHTSIRENRNGDWICDDCWDNERDDDNYDEDDTGDFCYDDSHNSFSDTKDFQSDDEGKIIKSKRKFGIELEIDAKSFNDARDLKKEIGKEFGFVSDGSVRGNAPLEIVSPVMKGKKGENEVIRICKKLSEKEAEANESCGFHTHNDTSDFRNGSYKVYELNDENLSEIEKMTKELLETNIEATKTHASVNKISVLLRKVDLPLLNDSILNYLKQVGSTPYHLGGHLTKNPAETDILYRSINGNEAIKFFALNKMTAKAKEGKKLLNCDIYGQFTKALLEGNANIENYAVVIFELQKPSELEILKNIIRLYVLFDDVIRSMLPSSRWTKNSYCRKMSKTFSIDDLRNIQSIEELSKYWYKSTRLNEVFQRQRNHYDETRYFGCNIHSYFEENKTIEIRYHSGTIDAKTILFWVDIHQTILDKIAVGVIDSYKIETADDNGFLLQDRVKSFLKLCGFNKNTENYIKSRVEHFTGTKIK